MSSERLARLALRVVQLGACDAGVANESMSQLGGSPRWLQGSEAVKGYRFLAQLDLEELGAGTAASIYLPTIKRPT